MDFPIHIDTISMVLPIVHFKGSQVEFSKSWYFLSLKVVLILANSADPDEMQHYAQFDTKSMKLPIVYFKGTQVELSKLWCISVPEGCLKLSKQCRPWWNAALCCISSASSLFVKVPI